MLVITQAPFLNDNMENYATFLLSMMNDPSLEVRQRIVQGITNIMELRMDIIMNNF
jgi:hypothetical protein